MIAKGPAARQTPPFSGQLVKVTGEGEHVTIAFTAYGAVELEAAVTAAGAVALKRLQTNNAAVLDAGAHFEDRQRQVYQHAVAQLRRELGMPEPPAGEESVTRADDSAGAVHAPENP
jgi:hypothetical protein